MNLKLAESDFPFGDPLAVPTSFARDHFLGSAAAPIVLLEYGDYECPDCGRAYPLLEELRKSLGDQLVFVFRHFPQYTVHTHASVAAQAAEAAGAQGKFWDMHDLLYKNQQNLETPDLTHYALRIGLEIYKFESSMDSGTFAKRVEEDFSSGQRSGVRGTPTLFINDRRYQGAVELEALKSALLHAPKRVG